MEFVRRNVCADFFLFAKRFKYKLEPFFSFIVFLSSNSNGCLENSNNIFNIKFGCWSFIRIPKRKRTYFFNRAKRGKSTNKRTNIVHLG